MRVAEINKAYGNGYQEGYKDGYYKGYDDAKAKYERPQGKWVGINEYLKHLEDTTGEKYKTSGLCDDRLFCNRCWKMSELMIKTNFCYECGASMENEEVAKEIDNEVN